MAEVVRFQLQGQALEASKEALAKRTALFAPLADEAGPVDYGEAELQTVLAALAPQAQRVLPLLLAWLGRAQEGALEQLLAEENLLHSFACAHLLGASELLEAARNLGARRLVGAVGRLEEADLASLTTCSRYGLSAAQLLHACAEADHALAARHLLSLEGEEEGPDLDALVEGRTALHVCAVRDSAEVAKVLLEHSASLTALCDPDEAELTRGLRTPLHLAAYHDSVEVLQLLLEAKAQVDCCVKGSAAALTPLHECCLCDAARCAQALAPQALAAEARQGQRLEKALEAMEVDEGPVEESIWCRFLDPLHAKVGHHGFAPLHCAAEHDAAGVAKALLAAKADAALGDDQGDTALHCAMLYGSPRTLAVLLEAGAQVVANGSGESALHLMAEFGPGDESLPEPLERRHFSRLLKCQQLLVEALRHRGELARALAQRSACGELPLHAAARQEHLGAVEAVRCLVEAKAELEATNEDGQTALALALRRRSHRVAALLRSCGAVEPRGDDLATALGGRVRSLGPEAMEVEGVILPTESIDPGNATC